MPTPRAKQIGYDNVASGLTAEEVQAALDEIVAAGGGLGVREIFQYPIRHTGGTVNNLGWPLIAINSTQQARCIFHIPSDFQGVTELVIITIPDATQTLGYDLATSYAAPGQGSNEHFVEALNESAGATDQQLLELVVPGALYANLAANDYLVLKIKSDTSDIRVLGMRLKYA